MPPRNVFTFETRVLPLGKVELTVPIPPGSRVQVLVLTQAGDEFADLVDAASSSTDFWDNPIDDGEWNHA